jgi:hypothetical protein
MIDSAWVYQLEIIVKDSISTQCTRFFCGLFDAQLSNY